MLLLLLLLLKRSSFHASLLLGSQPSEALLSVELLNLELGVLQSLVQRSHGVLRDGLGRRAPLVGDARARLLGYQLVLDPLRRRFNLGDLALNQLVLYVQRCGVVPRRTDKRVRSAQNSNTISSEARVTCG